MLRQVLNLRCQAVDLRTGCFSVCLRQLLNLLNQLRKWLFGGYGIVKKGCRQGRNLRPLGLELVCQLRLLTTHLLELSSGVGQLFLQGADILVFQLNFFLQSRVVALLGALRALVRQFQKFVDVYVLWLLCREEQSLQAHCELGAELVHLAVRLQVVRVLRF